MLDCSHLHLSFIVIVKKILNTHPFIIGCNGEKMSEEVDWDTFTKKFKSTRCRVEGDKLICEGVLDDKPAVCEVSQKDGKAEISCRKYDVSSPV